MAGGTINLAVKTTNDGSGLKAASNDMDAFGGKLTAFSAIATGGLLALGAGAIKMSADYQQAMSQVAAVSGATGAELTQLKALGKDIGADTAFSARDAAGAMQELAAGGRSVAQIMGGEARAAVDLAAAGNYGLADSGRTIATVMDVWKGTQISTNDVVNRLAGAANASRFGVEDMSQAVAQAGGVAAQMGVSFEDFTTAIAMSASSFASGSDAGTSYKTMLLNLDGSTDKAKAKIEELGLNFRDANGHILTTIPLAQELADKVGILGEAEQTAALKVIFGNDAYRTAAAMMDGAGEAATRVNDVLANTNAADVAATRMDNAKGSFEAFKGSAETLAISLGEKALPAMTNMADAGVDMLNGFSNLPEGVQHLGLAAAAVAISAPAAAAGIGKMAEMAKLLATGAGTSQMKVAALGLGVVALAAGADQLLKMTTGSGLIEHALGRAERVQALADATDNLGSALYGVSDPAERNAIILRNLTTEVGNFVTTSGKVDSTAGGWVTYSGDIRNAEESVRALGQAAVLNGMSVADMRKAYQSLPPELQRIFDEATNIVAIMGPLSSAIGGAFAGSMNTAVGKSAEAAKGVQGFVAVVNDAAEDIDALREALDSMNASFAASNPAVISLSASNAILQESIDDIKASGDTLTASQADQVAAMEAQIAANDAQIAAYTSNQTAMEGVQAHLELLMGTKGYAGLMAAMIAANEPHERVIDLTAQTREAFMMLATGDLPAAQTAFENLKAELSPAEWAEIAKALGTEFPGAIKTGMDAGVSEVRTGGENLGIAAGEGFEAGINASARAAVAAAVAMAQNAVAGVKAALQSQSPSKVFMAIGRDSGTGYALGLKASEPMVAKAAESMVGAAVDATNSIPIWGLAGGGNNRPTVGGGAAGGITAPGIAPAKPAGKLPLVPVGQDVYWDPNTGTFVNGTTNMPGTDATWNPATGELGTDAVQANGGLTVYQGSDGKWRRVVTDELATNPDGTWKTDRDRLDAIAYQSRAQAGNPALHTGGEHGIADGIAGSTMGVTGAYAAGYLGYMMADAIKYRMRPNELGHGALSDRFYNYGQDMSASGYGKSMYGPEARTAPAIDPWHPNALGGGMTRYWETDDSSAGGSWKTAGRRQVADTPKIVVNVSAMDSQSFLRAAPQIREAMRLDAKRGV